MIELLSSHLADGPDRPAIVDGAGEVTWRDLADRVAAWIRLFARAGLSSGDAVGMLLGNRREVFEALLAGLHSGLTVVPINLHLTAPEVAYILADSGASGLVTDEARAGAGGQAGAALKLLIQVEAPIPPARTVPQPICGQLMVYTSGTTGAPKGVLNGLFRIGDPFARVRRLLDYAGDVLEVPADGRVLLVGPWYHSAQLFFALMSLLRGSTLVIQERFSAASTLALIERERITHCHLVPTQFVRFLRLDDRIRHGFDPGALRRIWHGGAACPIDVKHRMIEWWGPVFTEYYGASEGGAVTLIDSHEWLKRPRSVGRPVPPNEILIADDGGEEVPPGVSGRVFVRRTGRGFSYHNADAKTRAAHLRPGVFTYGELGYLDDDGYLYLTGRAQDVIITGGVNVYPAEVEAVLLRHPAVRDAAVVGIPDEEFGERVAAVVEFESSEPADYWRELDRHCRTELAGFKVPRRYRAVDRLPRESTGKIRRDLLRELVRS